MSISVNRFLVVAFPLRCVVWLTVKKTCTLVAAIVFFGITFNFYSVFTFQLVDEKTCSNNVESSTVTKAMSLLTILFNSMIPYLVVIIMNILIIRKLKTQSDFRERNATVRSKETEDTSSEERVMKSQTVKRRKTEDDLTFTLLLVTSAFIVFTLPVYIK